MSALRHCGRWIGGMPGRQNWTPRTIATDSNESYPWVTMRIESPGRTGNGEKMQTDTAFSCRFEVRWADLDGNRHVRNTAFSEYASHTRFQLLAAHGFTPEKLEAMRFGPVMMREEIRYRREVLFGDALTVDVRCAGLSTDGSHWLVRQEIQRSDGKDAAILVIQGSWIHLDSRKAVSPPPELSDVLQTLPRVKDFAELPSVVRRGGALADQLLAYQS